MEQALYKKISCATFIRLQKVSFYSSKSSVVLKWKKNQQKKILEKTNVPTLEKTIIFQIGYFTMAIENA